MEALAMLKEELVSAEEKKTNPVQIVTPWTCSYSILLEATVKHALGP